MKLNITHMSGSIMAKRWALPKEVVDELCKKGEIPGAVKVGAGYWLIPIDSKRPRVKFN